MAGGRVFRFRLAALRAEVKAQLLGPPDCAGQSGAQMESPKRSRTRGVNLQESCEALRKPARALCSSVFGLVSCLRQTEPAISSARLSSL